MPFEYFVRPYQSPDSHGRIIVPSTPAITRERATLTWGAKIDGSLPTPTQQGVNVQCCNEMLQEDKRTNTPVKITASNEPENWIVVNRATEVKFQKHKQDNCAAEWDQMSGVASAIKESFAGLEHDIENRFDGKKQDHCHQTMKYQANTAPAA